MTNAAPALPEPGRPAKRAGLLGGAFDPPHEGHLRLAWLAWENLELDELRFVPALAPPLKRKSAAPPDIRLAMLRGMLAGTPFAVDDIEMMLGEVSYTVNTLEALSEREPSTAWILIMGSDQAGAFESWRGNGRIMELASVSIAPRPAPWAGNIDAETINAGALAPAAGPPLPNILSSRLSCGWSGIPGQAVLLPSTGLDTSSSQIRKQLASGEDPIGLSEQVKAAALQEGTYRNKEAQWLSMNA